MPSTAARCDASSYDSVARPIARQAVSASSKRATTTSVETPRPCTLGTVSVAGDAKPTYSPAVVSSSTTYVGDQPYGSGARSACRLAAASHSSVASATAPAGTSSSTRPAGSRRLPPAGSAMTVSPSGVRRTSNAR